MYMIMFVLDDPNRLDGVLAAWDAIGNLARLERRLVFVEVDALLLILVYFGGLWLLYSRGIGV